jgi:hypothetical protein
MSTTITTAGDPDVEARAERALDARARRAARAAGFEARKSRWRAGSCDNEGGFMLVNPRFNSVECGSRFDMSAEDVLAYCRD